MGSARRQASIAGKTMVVMRRCQACGNTQGPFDKLFIGHRKTGRWLFTCPVPRKDAEGRPLTDAARRDISAACNNRREKHGTAEEVVAG
jgi:hypothetical protein